MKLIVPVHNNRISPVFDWCLRMMLIEDRPGKAAERREIDISWLNALERVDRVAESGANAILCCGISSQLEGALQYRGLDVISWIHGDADEIVDQYLGGNSDLSGFLLPGAKRKEDGDDTGENKKEKNIHFKRNGNAL